MSRIVRRSGGEAVVGHNGVMGYGGRLSGSRWLALYVCDPWGWLTLTVTAPQSGPDLNPHGPDLQRCDSRDADNGISACHELVMCVRGGMIVPGRTWKSRSRLKETCLVTPPMRCQLASPDPARANNCSRRGRPSCSVAGRLADARSCILPTQRITLALLAGSGM